MLITQIKPDQILKTLNNNAEIALDEIGFDPPDKQGVRHRVCPFHPSEPEHQVGVWQARVTKGLACRIRDLPEKDSLDVYKADNGIRNRVEAAEKLLQALIAKHGKERLDLTALDQ